MKFLFNLFKKKPKVKLTTEIITQQALLILEDEFKKASKNK